MNNIAFIITGQLRTFFNIKNGLKDVLLLSKQHYNFLYVICVLNSNNVDDYSILTDFFNDLNINVQFVNYSLYLEEYKTDCNKKIINDKYINLKNNNSSACKAITDPDGYSTRHTWIQYHQLKIGIETLSKFITDSGIDFKFICKTRFDSKYPSGFFPHIPTNTDTLTKLSFNPQNKDKILNSMHKYNIKNIDELISFNENIRLKLPMVHIPIDHYALCFGGRVCYNYKSIKNICEKGNNDDILYSFNDYYYVSNKNTFMKLVNLYEDSCLYSNDNPDLSNHIFCPESQFMIFCLNNNIDIIMYAECFYDSMVYR